MSITNVPDGVHIVHFDVWTYSNLNFSYGMEAVQILIELATERKIVTQIVRVSFLPIYLPLRFLFSFVPICKYNLTKLIFRNVERGGIVAERRKVVGAIGRLPR